MSKYVDAIHLKTTLPEEMFRPASIYPVNDMFELLYGHFNYRNSKKTLTRYNNTKIETQANLECFDWSCIPFFI